MTLPSKSPITLPFGATTDPYSLASPHNGTDFAYIPDNQIYAPFSGKVTLVPNNGNDGNGIYMTEPNGNFHGMLHSSKYLVANGAQVTEGQPIGIMGETGFAQGVHLHWCVKVNNKFIDPMSLIEEDEMSYFGEVEFNNAYIAWFGPMEINPPTDNDRKRWIFNGIAKDQAGSNADTSESNTVIRAMQADLRHASWLAYIEDLKKPSPSNAIVLKPNTTYKTL